MVSLPSALLITWIHGYQSGDRHQKNMRQLIWEPCIFYVHLKSNTLSHLWELLGMGLNINRCTYCLSQITWHWHQALNRSVLEQMWCEQSDKVDDFVANEKMPEILSPKCDHQHHHISDLGVTRWTLQDCTCCHYSTGVPIRYSICNLYFCISVSTAIVTAISISSSCCPICIIFLKFLLKKYPCVVKVCFPHLLSS